MFRFVCVFIYCLLYLLYSPFIFAQSCGAPPSSLSVPGPCVSSSTPANGCASPKVTINTGVSTCSIQNGACMWNTPAFEYCQYDAPNQRCVTFSSSGGGWSNCGSAPACFLPGTEIGTPNGMEVVEKVKVGDAVKSFADGKIVESKVSQIFERERDFYFALKAGKYEVKASAEHPFLMWDSTYKQIQYLVPGDKVFVIDDDKLVLETVVFNTRVNEKTKVYNMSVDNTHTYFANGFAVHNKSGYTFPTCNAGTTLSCGTPPVEQCYQYLGDCGARFPSQVTGTCNGSGGTVLCQNNCGCCASGQVYVSSGTNQYSYQSNQTGTYNDGTPYAVDPKSCGGTGTWNSTEPVVGGVDPKDYVAGDSCHWTFHPGRFTWNGYVSEYWTLDWCGFTSNCMTGSCQTSNLSPSFSSLTVANNLTAVVVSDTGSQNHICQSSFNNSRTINATVNASDPNGLADIADVQLRWNGIVFLRNSLINGVASFTHTFTAIQNDIISHDFQVNITDSEGNSTGWISTGRNFKVWDCVVPVTLQAYDGSTGQACNNIGFANSLSITDYIFKNLSGGSDATTSLIWNNSYLPLVNGGTVLIPDGNLQASSRFTRLIDMGVGTTICPSSAQFDVSADVFAYSVNPSLAVDLSYILDQEGWFQGRGLDIRAKTEISSGVPITINSALSVDNVAIGVSNNGMVASASFRNTTGNNNASYGIPNNWYQNNLLTDPKKYGYQKIYNNYFEKMGLGTTGATTISTGDTGVFFVNGDLTIGNNIVLTANKFLMVVVSGSINIDPTVTRVDGIYVADGGINAIGSSNSQLVINGILYTLHNIRLARSFTVKSDNNLTPAVVVNYRPDLIFAMPGKLNNVLSNWNEN